VVPQLQKKGEVSRGWLGVQIQPVTAEIAESLGLKTPTGALVSEPQADSPAAKAGLKSGDVITSVNAIEVKDPRDLARKISTLGPDEAVSLGIIRDGKEQTISLKLGQLTDQKVRRSSANGRGGHQLGSLGLTVVPATRIEGAGEKGLAVVGVDPNGKAAELGFKQGDIILKAGNRDMSSFADLTAAMLEAAAGGRKNTLVMIKRDQAQHYVAVLTAISCAGTDVRFTARRLRPPRFHDMSSIRQHSSHEAFGKRHERDKDVRGQMPRSATTGSSRRESEVPIGVVSRPIHIVGKWGTPRRETPLYLLGKSFRWLNPHADIERRDLFGRFAQLCSQSI
jgi:membrane-associated protease RseP (regulator of RpoE activity)